MGLLREMSNDRVWSQQGMSFSLSLTILDWSAISLSIGGRQHSRYEHVSTNACFRSANVKEECFV